MQNLFNQIWIKCKTFLNMTGWIYVFECLENFNFCYFQTKLTEQEKTEKQKKMLLQFKIDTIKV